MKRKRIKTQINHLKNFLYRKIQLIQPKTTLTIIPIMEKAMKK